MAHFQMYLMYNLVVVSTFEVINDLATSDFH